MLNKEQAKEKLKKLVKDFKSNSDYYKKLSEADVEDKLVWSHLVLFSTITEFSPFVSF